MANNRRLENILTRSFDTIEKMEADLKHQAIKTKNVVDNSLILGSLSHINATPTKKRNEDFLSEVLNEYNSKTEAYSNPLKFSVRKMRYMIE